MTNIIIFGHVTTQTGKTALLFEAPAEEFHTTSLRLPTLFFGGQYTGTLNAPKKEVKSETTEEEQPHTHRNGMPKYETEGRNES